MPKLTSHTAIYHRLAEMARLNGLRLSWRKGRVSILVAVVEDLTPEQADEYLRKGNFSVRYDAALDAYTAAHDKLNGNQPPRSLGAAAFPWQAHEALRIALAPKLVGICRQPMVCVAQPRIDAALPRAVH